MAQRPRIGVTGKAARFSPSWWCTRLAIRLAGGRACRISVKHGIELDSIDGLIIGGGDDIHPELYDGALSGRQEYDRDRDHLEKKCIEHALEKGLPVLGICRGAQLLNVVRGGKLHSDIRAMRRRTSNRRQIAPRKKALVEIPSLLHSICAKRQLRINSLHHQAVSDCGENIVVCARDLDDIVQAIAFKYTAKERGLGVQWHPEYLFYLPAHFRIFRWLVHQARRECSLTT